MVCFAYYHKDLGQSFACSFAQEEWHATTGGRTLQLWVSQSVNFCWGWDCLFSTGFLCLSSFFFLPSSFPFFLFSFLHTMASHSIHSEWRERFTFLWPFFIFKTGTHLKRWPVNMRFVNVLITMIGGIYWVLIMYCSKWLIDINSFNTRVTPWVCIIIIIYRWQIWGTERLICLRPLRSEIWAQVVVSRICSSPLWQLPPLFKKTINIAIQIYILCDKFTKNVFTVETLEMINLSYALYFWCF